MTKVEKTKSGTSTIWNVTFWH